MVSKEFLTEVYRILYTVRVFETRCIKLYRQGLIIGYFHPYLGEEAVATGVCAALGADDFIASTHRGHGHCIARGGDLKRMVAEIMGKKTGYCCGMGGSMHIADLSVGNLGANGIVAAGIPLAVGAGLGIKIRKEKAVSVVFFSDGASCNGTFGESLNLATAWDLPVIFVVENNQYAVSTTVEECARETDIHKRGDGYGTANFLMDGNDVLAVYDKTREAVELCHAGKGPVLLEAKTFRHGGHHVNDPGLYMPKDKLEHYLSRDPVDIGRTYLVEKGDATEAEVKAIEQAVDEAMEEAIAFAKDSPEMSFEEFKAFATYQ